MKTKADLIQENIMLKCLLLEAVKDIGDIHKNVNDDYVCSKCNGFNVYTMCDKKSCEFKWRLQGEIEKWIDESKKSETNLNDS